MGYATFHTLSMTAELSLALWLYCRPLPPREGFWSRVATALGCTVTLAFVATRLGFTLFPSLTDDASFVRALLSFGGILVFMTAAVMLVWDATFLTALFCSSSAYLLQNLASGVDRALHMAGLVPMTQGFVVLGVSLPNLVSALASAGFTFWAFYLLFVRHITGEGLHLVSNASMLFCITAAMLVSIVFDLVVKDLPTLGIPWRYPLLLAFVHVAICAFILIAEYEIIYNGSLRTNVATMERMVREQERQYAVSRETIAVINRRVHDMRHDVFDILGKGDNHALSREQLAQVARAIQVYDSSVKTGNAALDVVLTEKGLLCAEEGMALTCVADGHALDFMAAADIYTLFGTAVDGAVEAVRRAQDDERRAISLNVREAMGMASIAIEHYLPGGYAKETESEAGGERLEVMHAIVERYGGTFVMDPRPHDTVFHFDALIPIPE